MAGVVRLFRKTCHDENRRYTSASQFTVLMRIMWNGWLIISEEWEKREEEEH
jgi:hypothetical protein